MTITDFGGKFGISFPRSKSINFSESFRRGNCHWLYRSGAFDKSIHGPSIGLNFILIAFLFSLMSLSRLFHS